MKGRDSLGRRGDVKGLLPFTIRKHCTGVLLRASEIEWSVCTVKFPIPDWGLNADGLTLEDKF